MIHRVGLVVLTTALVTTLQGVPTDVPPRADLTEDLVRAYLWPSSEAEFQRAAEKTEADQSLEGVSRQRMHDLEEWMRRGPPLSGGVLGARGDQLDEFVVSTPGGREIPVMVRIPTRYTSGHSWPLMLAMHGGPPGNVEGATRSARLVPTSAAPSGGVTDTSALIPTSVGESEHAKASRVMPANVSFRFISLLVVMVEGRPGVSQWQPGGRGANGSLRPHEERVNLTPRTALLETTRDERRWTST